MADALLLVDVINDFRHEDGGVLLESFRRRLGGFRAVLRETRSAGIPVVYANDAWGVWDGDVRRLVTDALEGRGGDVAQALAPQPGDRFVVKPRYSAFDSTPLALVLEALDARRLLIGGAATEMCVVQTAIAADQQGYEVTVAARACATVDEHGERVALDYLRSVLGIDVAG